MSKSAILVKYVAKNLEKTKKPLIFVVQKTPTNHGSINWKTE